MRLYCIDFMLLFIHCLPFWLDQGVVGTCFIYGFVGVAFHLVRHPGRHWEKKQTTWNNHHSITTTFKKRVPPISNQSWSKISLTFPTKKTQQQQTKPLPPKRRTHPAITPHLEAIRQIGELAQAIANKVHRLLDDVMKVKYRRAPW